MKKTKTNPKANVTTQVKGLENDSTSLLKWIERLTCQFLFLCPWKYE